MDPVDDRGIDFPIESEHYLAVTVKRAASGRATVLHVEGHLDHDTVPLLRQRVAPYVRQAGRPLAFDLSRLKRMTSAGVGLFLNVRRAQERCGSTCVFVNLPSPIRRVFDVMDAAASDAVFASTREMDEYLAKIQDGEIDPLSQSIGTTSGANVHVLPVPPLERPNTPTSRS